MSEATNAVGALAMSYINRALARGEEITIPSLGIVLRENNVSAIDDKARELGALMDAADLRAQLAAATQRAETAEAALALATNSTPGKGTGVWVPLDKWQELQTRVQQAETALSAEFVYAIDLINRYGQDQWRRGVKGQASVEFTHWKAANE